MLKTGSLIQPLQRLIQEHNHAVVLAEDEERLGLIHLIVDTFNAYPMDALQVRHVDSFHPDVSGYTSSLEPQEMERARAFRFHETVDVLQPRASQAG